MDLLCGVLILTHVALSQIIHSHFALTSDDVIFFLTTSVSSPIFLNFFFLFITQKPNAHLTFNA